MRKTEKTEDKKKERKRERKRERSEREVREREKRRERERGEREERERERGEREEKRRERRERLEISLFPLRPFRGPILFPIKAFERWVETHPPPSQSNQSRLDVLCFLPYLTSKKQRKKTGGDSCCVLVENENCSKPSKVLVGP